jgi:hypothetical protein
MWDDFRPILEEGPDVNGIILVSRRVAARVDGHSPSPKGGKGVGERGVG